MLRKSLIVLMVTLAFTSFSFATENEQLTITTYYPSPYGSYNELSTYNNTYLATEGGRVGIGTTTPGYKLDVNATSGNQAKFGSSFPVYIVDGSPSIGFNSYFSPSDLSWKLGKGSTNNYGGVIVLDRDNGAFIFRNTNTSGAEGATILTAAAPNNRMVIERDGDVGIGTSSPQGRLDVSSTSGAFIPPRMSTTQRNSLSAVNGSAIYNTDNQRLETYSSSSWNPLGMTMVGGTVFQNGQSGNYDVSDADLIYLSFYVNTHANSGAYWLERKQDSWFMCGLAVGGTYSGCNSITSLTSQFRLTFTDAMYDVQMKIVNMGTFYFWTYSGLQSGVCITKFKKH